MKKTASFLAILALCIVLAAPVMAHTPLCACWDNGDGTITCEGGFSDGSSAAGVEIRAVDEDGKVLVKGAMDQLGEFTFDKPKGDYKVEFDAGPGHVVEMDGKDIAE
ncbi:MAG: hypothetical protein ACLFOY_13315 [Desulfatibacillaceae bacterium]